MISSAEYRISLTHWPVRLRSILSYHHGLEFVVSTYGITTNGRNKALSVREALSPESKTPSSQHQLFISDFDANAPFQSNVRMFATRSCRGLSPFRWSPGTRRAQNQVETFYNPLQQADRGVGKPQSDYGTQSVSRSKQSTRKVRCLIAPRLKF